MLLVLVVTAVRIIRKSGSNLDYLLLSLKEREKRNNQQQDWLYQNITTLRTAVYNNGTLLQFDISFGLGITILTFHSSTFKKEPIKVNHLSISMIIFLVDIVKS